MKRIFLAAGLAALFSAPVLAQRAIEFGAYALPDSGDLAVPVLAGYAGLGVRLLDQYLRDNWE